VPRRLLTRLLDWLCIDWQNDVATLPLWPRPLCSLLTKHATTVKWADYFAEVAGVRCKCGLLEKHR
jgi:hypothetical protein